MSLFVFLVWPLLMFVFGFFPLSLALLGKADMVASLKFAIVPGIFGFMMATYFFTTANNVLLPTIVQTLLGANTSLAAVAQNLYAVQVVAIILGLASAAFVCVGITGFYFKPEAAPVTAWVVNFTGILLIILGIFVGYWHTYLAFNEVYIAAAMVFLFGVACLVAGFSVLGKMKGGYPLLAIVVINFLLAFVILFMNLTTIA
ncbi:MAG: hypothetical protein ABSF36_02905 [Candidatus Methanomethylicaceae archaeon]